MGVAPILWLAAIDPATQAVLAPMTQTLTRLVGQ
jgi:hypothetical protein